MIGTTRRPAGPASGRASRWSVRPGGPARRTTRWSVDGTGPVADRPGTGRGRSISATNAATRRAASPGDDPAEEPHRAPPGAGAPGPQCGTLDTGRRSTVSPHPSPVPPERASGHPAAHRRRCARDRSRAAAGSRLDPWVDSYAERTRSMTASEIRALFAVASRPEVVSLAGGMPYVAALPLDAVAEAVGRLLAERGTRALQYGSGQGDECLREQITSRCMPLEGIHAHPDDVVVTVGSQQALDLVTRVFVDPGDVILVEAPSYVGALSAFAAYQADVVHVAMDDAGPGARGAARGASTRLAPGGQAGQVPLHDPELPQPGRRHARAAAPAREILEICAARRAPGPRGRPLRPARLRRRSIPRAMRADERRRRDLPRLVLQDVRARACASAGRVAPHGVREKLVLAAEASRCCARRRSPSWRSSRYLADQPWLDQVKAFRELYRERRDAMLESLADLHARRAPPGPCPTAASTSGSPCPTAWTPSAMLPRAVTARVAYVPGTGFFADGQDRPEAGPRCGCRTATPSPDRIREGVRRLAGVVEEELELRRDLRRLGPTGPARRSTDSEQDSDTPDRTSHEHRRRWHRSTAAVPSSSPAGSRTSATSRCAPAGASPRRCAARASRCDVLDVDAALLPALRRRAARRRCSRCCTAQAGEDGAVRDVLELLGAALRRRPARRLPGRLRQAGRQDRRCAAAGLATSRRRRAAARDVPRARRGRRARRHRRAPRAPARRQARPRRVSPRGVAWSATPSDLPARHGRRFAYGDTALVERFVAGTEVAVSVVDRGDGPVALPAVEIVPDGGVYDYAARYTAGATEFFAPARLGRRRCRRRRRGRGARARGARAARPLACRPDRRRRRDAVVPRGQRRARHDRDLAAARSPRRPPGSTSARCWPRVGPRGAPTSATRRR